MTSIKDIEAECAPALRTRQLSYRHGLDLMSMRELPTHRLLVTDAQPRLSIKHETLPGSKRCMMGRRARAEGSGRGLLSPSAIPNLLERAASKAHGRMRVRLSACI